MKILVSGSTGLIGSALVERLHAGGHEVVRLVRRGSAKSDEGPQTRVPKESKFKHDGRGQGAGAPCLGEVGYDLGSQRMEPGDLVGIDAVVHLAGENIAGLWTKRKKAAIGDSRVMSTALIAKTLAAMDRPPSTFVCASAVGFYGCRGDEELDENSAAGSGFLAEVCKAWEAAADPARDKGVRVVHLRQGIVLSTRGGPLAKMLPPFRLGLGGAVGRGTQWMSWVSLDDAVRAIQFALERPELSGAVNVVSPKPVTNRTFTKTLGAVLHRPTVAPLPEAVVHWVLGEMGDELLLSSIRAVPKRLHVSGFHFEQPTLEAALTHILHTKR